MRYSPAGLESRRAGLTFESKKEKTKGRVSCVRLYNVKGIILDYRAVLKGFEYWTELRAVERKKHIKNI